MGPLKTKMLGEMQLKNFSEKTIKSYLYYIQDIANYSRKSPAVLITDEIKKYLLYLINERKLSASTVNIAHSSLTFFYTRVLENKRIMEFVSRQKIPNRKPAVLSTDEVAKIIDCIVNIKHKAIIITLYSAGLRVGEVVNLKVSDIDSDRMQIFIRQSKGKKDRYVPLSKKALKYLRLYWEEYRPSEWLFYSRHRKHKKYSVRSVEKVFKDKVAKVGIEKKVTVHTLRHSYATHMLENGIGIHHLQLLMGHSSPKTTAIYIHVQKKDILNIMSPLDTLFFNEQLPQASGISRGSRCISSGRKGLHKTESA